MNKVQYKNFVLLIILFFTSAYLLFTNLDSRSFWTGDEATSVFVSRSVAKYGLPYCFYQNKIIEDEQTWCKNKLYTEYLWLHNYLSALSIFLFGFSVYSARLPFAILGIVFVFLVYYITKKHTNNTNLALLTSTATLTTVYYLLLFRVARYYGVALILAILMIDAYQELVKNNKKIYFLIVSMLAVLNHFGIFLVQIAGLITHYFLFFFKQGFLNKILEDFPRVYDWWSDRWKIFRTKRKSTQARRARILPIFDRQWSIFFLESVYKTIWLISPIIFFLLTFAFFGQNDIAVHHTGKLTTSEYASNLYSLTIMFFRFFMPLPVFLVLLPFARQYVNKFVFFHIIIIMISLLTASFRGALFHYAYIPAGYSVIFLLSHTIFTVYQNKKLFGIILGIIVLFTNILHVTPVCLSENCSIQSNFLEYILDELQEDYYDPQELITEYFNKNVPQGGTLTYGGSEAIAIYYFTQMNVTPTGLSDYAIYFNASIDPASKYDLVKEFSYTSLFPQEYYLKGHGQFHSFEFKGKSPFPEDHRFSIQSIKKFRLYKLKNHSNK